MQLSDFSLGGIILFLFMVCGALALIAVNDRRFMMRILRVFIFYAVSLFFVTLCLWGVYLIDRWWANALWAFLMALGVTYYLLHKSRLSIRKMFFPLLVGVVVGLGLVQAIMTMTIPYHGIALVAPVVGVAAGLMQISLTSGLKSYIASLRYTKSHYQYMQANGATNKETVMPSVKRGLRAAIIPLLNKMIAPVVIAPPVFMLGLLLTGLAPVPAAIITLGLLLSVFASCILSFAVVLLLSYRVLFDRSGRFILD